jgi:hypothetical protein
MEIIERGFKCPMCERDRAIPRVKKYLRDGGRDHAICEACFSAHHVNGFSVWQEIDLKPMRMRSREHMTTSICTCASSATTLIPIAAVQSCAVCQAVYTDN